MPLVVERLVVPYDFSEYSEAALSKAREIADETTKTYVVHVVVPVPPVAIDSTTPIPMPLDSELCEMASERMKRHFREHDIENVEVICRVGDPGSEIVDYARQIGADMIVMSSHGRTGVKRFLLGSVAERVLRTSDCPVLILREKSE